MFQIYVRYCNRPYASHAVILESYHFMIFLLKYWRLFSPIILVSFNNNITNENILLPMTTGSIPVYLWIGVKNVCSSKS